MLGIEKIKEKYKGMRIEREHKKKKKIKRKIKNIIKINKLFLYINLYLF